MSLGKWLQAIGGEFELLGILTVALGISETRRAFTDRPSLVGRARTFLRRLVARFRRKDAKVAAVSAAGSLETAGKVRPVVKMGPWADLTVEEKVERLKNMAQRHEDQIAALDDQLDREVEERKSGDRQGEREREALKQTLEARIRLAAAGGLRLQVAGVLAFAAGVVLATWGNLIS